MRKPPRRRSLTLATPQKSFVCDFPFARDPFFPLKGKQNFSVVSCSDEQGGGAGYFLFPLGRDGIPPPNPLLPPRPRLDGRNFWRRHYYTTFSDISALVVSLLIPEVPPV